MPAIDRSQSKQRINEQIRVSPVRVIAADGQQLGILATEEAMKAAREAGLDLVEVAPQEKPPVCRIMDYGKFKYQQAKRKKDRTHAHQFKVKEIRLRPKTDEHDITVKINRARRFLEHRDKVVLSLVFRGREMAHVEEGQRLIQQVLEELGDICKVESAPTRHGRRMVCMLAPK